MPIASTLQAGLIGRGIGSSRSPRIHEAEAAALGTSMNYRLIDFTALELDDAELAQIVRKHNDLGHTGSNVTFPFKQAVMSSCDTLSDAATILGAVNTLVFRDGRVRGENTDWVGFTWLIEREIGSVAANRIAQVGAGGAGSATAFALARLGASEVALHDPSPGRAKALAARLTPHFPDCRFTVWSDAAGAIAASHGVVNATPVGMASVPGLPFDPALLEPGQWLADIIYFPLETNLLGAARRSGHKVANGVSMVVGQAAEAFRLMTGLEPDRERMLARLDAEIAAERRLGDAA
jgi:shikimate dehydrogenase